MDDPIVEALARGGIVDITTTGRRSGKPTRIEIVFHNLDGDLFITGRPGRRDWYANLVAEPRFTLHLKRRVEADLAAVAELVTEAGERESLLFRIMTEGFRIDTAEATKRLPAWIDRAPLIKFHVGADG